jgi:hypothetical protein
MIIISYGVEQDALMAGLGLPFFNFLIHLVDHAY